MNLQNYSLQTISSIPSVTKTTRQLNLTVNSSGLIPSNSYGALLVLAEHTKINKISRAPLTSQLCGAIHDSRTHFSHTKFEGTWTLAIYFFYADTSRLSILMTTLYLIDDL